MNQDWIKLSVMFFRRIQTSFRWRFLKPKLPSHCDSVVPTMRLGSKYGGKIVYIPKQATDGLVVISGGVGEDISFDIELLNLTGGSKYYLIDPSPPAIAHMNKITSSFGNPKTQEYSSFSKQDPSVYDLTRINSCSFHFMPLALWNQTGKVKFYPPLNATRDSSGSLNAIQTHYKIRTPPILVDCITIGEIVRIHKLTHIDLLKLDIEGAVLEVLQSMFEERIFPKQIVVEFDEMHFPSVKSKFRSRLLFRLIKNNGYTLINIDSCDFTFLLE